MEESLLISLKVAVGALADALVLFAVLFVGRAFYKLTTKADLEDEVSEKDSPAMGLALAGYLVGLAIAVSGAIMSPQVSWDKSCMVAAVGIVSMLLMRLSLVVNDKLILSKFNNLSLIVGKRNLGVGFVEAGGCVATGLMINGVLSGKADTLEDKFLYGGLYWVIGQAALILGALSFRTICGYDLDDELENHDNVSAGISFGGFLAAIGIVIQAAMTGTSTDVAAEVATIAVFFAAGVVLMLLGQMVLNKVLVPKSPMSKEIGVDRNRGAGALSAAGFVCIATLFAASISPATTFATLSDSMRECPAPTAAPAAEPVKAQPK
jgi:uncharacterized membrane protein YjfL (UPF0719 family)